MLDDHVVEEDDLRNLHGHVVLVGPRLQVTDVHHIRYEFYCEIYIHYRFKFVD